MSDAPRGGAVRVLEVVPRSAGGIGHHVAEIITALDGRDGLTIEVAGPEGIASPMPKQILSLEVPDGLRGHARTIRRLRRLASDVAPHVVHAHGLRAGVDAGLVARRAGVPCAVTVHNLVREEIAGRVRATLYRRAEQAAVRLADVVFAPSAQIATYLRREVPSAADRIEVLYIPPERPCVRRSREDVRAELGLARSDRLVVTVTRLAPQKALHVMLEALAELPPAFVLAIAGEGPLKRELEQLADRLGVLARIRWLGWRDDVGDLIAAADAFCLSSLWEAVGLAAQEAVLLGTPVVTTAVGGMGELVEDRLSGRLVPFGDRRALAAALEEVAGTPRGRAYADRAARDYAQRFSRAASMERLRSTYVRLAALRGSGA